MTGKEIRLEKARLKGTVLILLGLVIIAAVLPFRARAHGVYLFAWVEGDRVYTESSFGGKKGVVGGLIKVFGPSGALLLEGKTNDQGEFSFKIPRKTDLRITLEAGAGHMAEYVLKAGELGGGGEEEEAEPVAGMETAGPGPQKSPVRMDPEQIRALMEEVLEAKLKPIQRTMARMREEKGPDLTEVIGGLGYIFGLMGIILYFRNRKSK